MMFFLFSIRPQMLKITKVTQKENSFQLYLLITMLLLTNPTCACSFASLPFGGSGSASPEPILWLLRHHSRAVFLNWWAAALQWATELFWWATRLFYFAKNDHFRHEYHKNDKSNLISYKSIKKQPNKLILTQFRV